MLIALFTALYFLVFAGSGQPTLDQEFKRLSSLASEHIADKDRAAEVHKLITEMETSLQSFQQEVLNLRRQALTVDSNYRATRADYQRIFDLLDQAWVRQERSMVDVRFRMKEHMTKDEWTAVFEALQKDR